MSVNGTDTKNALLAAEAGAPEAVYPLAVAHFRAEHPTASERDIRTAAAVFVYYVTDGDIVGEPEKHPVEQWLMRVVDRVDPDEPEIALRLIDALCFLPRPGSEAQRVVREVVDLLAQTRHSFRSKQIERARVLLEGVL